MIQRMMHSMDNNAVTPPTLLAGERRVEALDEEECLALLASVPIGRLAYVVDGRPVIVPVDFMVHDRQVVFRTDPGDKLSHTPLQHVCFEADSLREMNAGWSVVLNGLARDVTTALGSDYDRLRAQIVPTLAPLRSPHWISISIDTISGRRLRTPLAADVSDSMCAPLDADVADWNDQGLPIDSSVFENSAVARSSTIRKASS